MSFEGYRWPSKEDFSKILQPATTWGYVVPTPIRIGHETAGGELYGRYDRIVSRTGVAAGSSGQTCTTGRDNKHRCAGSPARAPRSPEIFREFRPPEAPKTADPALRIPNFAFSRCTSPKRDVFLISRPFLSSKRMRWVINRRRRENSRTRGCAIRGLRASENHPHKGHPDGGPMCRPAGKGHSLALHPALRVRRGMHSGGVQPVWT